MAQPKASLVVKRVLPEDEGGAAADIPFFKLQVLPSSSLETGQPYAIALWADEGYELVSRSGNFRQILSADEAEAAQQQYEADLVAREQTNTEIAQYMEANGLTVISASLALAFGDSVYSEVFNRVNSHSYSGSIPLSGAGSTLLTAPDPHKVSLNEALDALAEEKTEAFTLTGGHSITPEFPVKSVRSLKVPPKAELLAFDGQTLVDLSDRPTYTEESDGSIELFPERVIALEDDKEEFPQLYGCVEIVYKPKAPQLFRSPGESQEGKYALIYQHNSVRKAIRVSNFQITEPDTTDEDGNEPAKGARRVIMLVRDFCTDVLLQGAAVSVSGPATAGGLTDTLGQVDLGVLPYGEYSISISKSGYQTNTTDALSNESFTINEQQVF